jgi:hypothetical protein
VRSGVIRCWISVALSQRALAMSRIQKCRQMAAGAGRILVSHEFQTMPSHFREFTRRRRSPGVLLIRQDLPVGQAVDGLLLIWEASEADEWVNRVCVVPSLVTIAISGG